MSKIQLKNVSVDLEGMEQVKKDLLKTIKDKAIRNAIEYAQSALLEAWDKSGHTDRTKNLLDSYVWGVYLDGKRQAYGFINPSQLATEKRKQTATGDMQYGREEAQSFIDSYNSRIPNGIEIVLATAMYYGAYLENGTARNRKYIVLTAVQDKLERDFSDVKVTISEYKY